ncbi:MAG: hypothetical protein ACJAUA_000453, partial [Zhongshania aliphaticivorans]
SNRIYPLPPLEETFSDTIQAHNGDSDNYSLYYSKNHGL